MSVPLDIAALVRFTERFRHTKPDIASGGRRIDR